MLPSKPGEDEGFLGAGGSPTHDVSDGHLKTLLRNQVEFLGGEDLLAK